MNRRRLLALGLALAAATAARAHTPYRQWTVYRKRHLMVLGHRADPEGYELVRAVAGALDRHLPESRARPSRAGDARRAAALLSTGQMDVAVLAPEEAAAAAEGRLGAEPVALEVLLELGDRLLVARADFPDDHAYLVVQALDRHQDALPTGQARLPGGSGALAPHPGAVAYREGRPAPGAMALGGDDELPEDHDHPH